MQTSHPFASTVYVVKKTPTTRLGGLHNDGQAAAENVRRTAAQKVTHLELIWVRLLISVLWFLETL